MRCRTSPTPTTGSAILSRSDANTSLSEAFVYDALNRLTSATVNLSPTPLAKAFAYDAVGNMLSKSDLGNYSYAPPGSPLPHAVTAVSGGSISTTFTYDPNGNQTAGLGRTISYTSYNKPASITLGARTISFLDDTEHQRFKQVTPEGATLYIAAFGVLAELSSPGATGQKWTDYLSVGNAKVGMRVLQTASATVTTRYFHTDHLGSISVITNESGVVQERLSYDAWGKRRNANGTDDTAGAIASQTTRGFTGEEELSIGGLVHLNGRIYDPVLGRMTSADPTVTDPMNPQGWNRYSYVGNDPLAFTDPNGFSWLSDAWHGITNFFQNNPIVRAILQIAVTIVIAALLPAAIGAAATAFISAAGGSAVATGLSGGNLGQVLKAAAIAGVTALATFGVGEATAHGMPAFDSPDFNASVFAENVAGHALVGCASSVASGGSCQSGALSGAVGAAVGPLTVGQNFGFRLAVSTVAGGLASVAGGGKFANGAITGAFGYLFNEAMKHGVTATITTKLYEIYRNPRLGSDGVDIALLGNVSDPSAYSQYNWVQTVTTNQPVGGRPMFAPYIDAAPDNAPYYYSKATNQQYENEGVAAGGVTMFTDAPTRLYTGAPISWQANLSLVGINANGSYDVLKTVSYGFTRDATGVHLSPVVGK